MKNKPKNRKSVKFARQILTNIKKWNSMRKNLFKKIYCKLR